MKKRNVVIFFLALSLILSAQDYNRKEINLTIYNSNLGVVKDLREINIDKGTTEIKLSDVAKLIDPTSVHIKLDGIILEQNYQYDLVSTDKILQKYIDRDINLIDEDGNLISGKLLSVYGGQYVIQNPNGGLTLIPNIDKYKIKVESLPEGLITKPTLVWLVQSNNSGKKDVEVTYQTGGLSWSAEYVVLLNENDTKLDLNSWVSINNRSGASYKDANLKLIAGDLNLVRSRDYPNMVKAQYDAGVMMEAAPQFEEKSFFEYHIYDLQRKTNVLDNETKQIALFESENVSINKKYLYQSGSNKVGVYVEFKNSSENNLGIPMPKGKVRVYKSDGESPQFIGEDMIDHTPKNEKLSLKIGEAFDITAEEKMTDSRKITNKINEQDYEITIKNRKEESISVNIEKYFGLNWKITSSNFDFKKVDASKVEWILPVDSDNETILKFTVRYEY
ncbi:MAG: DUF4139 domain-containing protein [Melioribacteraceae bacterium]|nr:DUF4139 domain-containing protein [Melioribacteraceae bacterium]